MITITDLPLELLLFIIEYICDHRSSGSLFASVNRSLSSVLLLKARRIFVRTNDEKWRLSENRSKLLRMIDNPYHQLWLGHFNDAANVSPLPSVVTGLHSLSELYSPTLISIFLNIPKSKSFQIKNLFLNGNPVLESFDILPCLESLLIRDCRRIKIEKLNLSSYPNLRSLCLSGCLSVTDVSCLDGIYKLELDYLDITDISCLNKNYRVKISDCNKITNYSKSFRYTRSLEIDPRPDLHVTLESCLHLTSLSIANSMGNISFQTLTNLSLIDINRFETLPPNKLQRVTIIRCCNFNSLDNMDQIRSIHLEDLNKITTLTGLGPKNKIIILKYMKRLEDISSLKESQTVKIHDCPQLFTSNRLSCLRTVKELHLSQGYNCGISNFLLSLNQLRDFFNLNELKLSLTHQYYTAENNQSLQFLIIQTLINIEKITLCDTSTRIISDIIREVFIVNVSGKSREIILLRKKVSRI